MMSQENFQQEIQFALDSFPSEVKITHLKTGPTYLEFKSAVGVQNCCFMCLILIFISIAIAIWDLTLVGGIFMIIIAGFLLLAMLGVNRHAKKFPFVIDLDQQKIYPDMEKEISWDQIQLIQLVHKQENRSGNNQSRRTVHLFALILKCNDSTQNTIILHGYTQNQAEMVKFGEYLSSLFTKYLNRSIEFNSAPSDETTSEKTTELY